MSWDDKVIWSEGMFLRAQHFQQQDRYVERLVRGRVAGLRPFAWGISELTINRELLAVGKFAVLRCKGILEDGTPINIPDDDDPPPPLDLPETLANSIVYLALPVRQRGGVEFEVGESADAATRYVGEETETVDAIAGSASVSRIRTGRLRLRYRLERQERAGYHCLGLARIQEVRSDRRATLDERYVPPALNVQALAPLAGFVTEIQGLLNSRSEALAARVAGSNGRGAGEMADFLMLQVANRSEPLFANIARMPDIHPERLHGMMLSLAGELATFTAVNKRPPAFPPYRHDDLQGTMEPVMAEIRRSLSAVLEQTAIPIDLLERKYGIRVGTIADRSLITTATFVLAVRADMPGEALRRNFPALVKIGPVEQIRELVNVQLPGIRVRPLPVAPRQLPYHAGAVYFELERGSPIWKQLATSGGIAVHLAGDFPQVAMELWAIRG